MARQDENRPTPPPPESPPLEVRGEKRKSPSVSSKNALNSSSLDLPPQAEPPARLQVLRERSHSPSNKASTTLVEPVADPPNATYEEAEEPPSRKPLAMEAKPPVPERLPAPIMYEASADSENRVPSHRPIRHPSAHSALAPKPQPLSGSGARAPLGDVPALQQKQSFTAAPHDRVVPLKAGSVSPPDYAKEALPPQAQQQQYQQHASHRSADGLRQAPAGPLPAPPQAALPQQMQQQQQSSSTSAATQSIRKATHVTVNGKQYLRSALLGKGGSSRVYRVTDRDHNVFALKKVELGKGDLETYTSFCNEIELLKRLRGHDRIIQLVDSEVNEAKRTLIMVSTSFFVLRTSYSPRDSVQLLEIGEIDLNSLLQERVGKRVGMNFIRQTWEQVRCLLHPGYFQG